MLRCFALVRELNTLSVAIRLFAAMFCGGLIGMEREFKRRPAGFRTHILICLGAAVTTLTSQYLYLELHLYTDIARLGAQVIAGVGFIGAGSIVVTHRQNIKGLTTAAGLWTTAIVGLACGAGYLEGALAVTALLLLAEIFLIKLEYRFARQVRDVNFYVEYARPDCIEEVVHLVRERHVRITGLEVTRTRPAGEEDYRYCAVLSVQLKNGKLAGGIRDGLGAIGGVLLIEEL